MTKFNGTCHCKQTSWTAELPSDAQSHVLCHCDACKVMSGGEYTLNQIIPKENFQLTKGDLKTYTYKGDSGNSVGCFYCPNCTSNAYHHQHIMGDKIVIRTALLDGTKSWSQPAVEIFLKDKLSWQPEVGQKGFQGPPE